MPTRRARDRARIRKLLDALAEGHTIAESCRVAGIAFGTLKTWRRNDPIINEKVQEAYDIGTDAYRQEVRRRALEGWLEPVFYKGQEQGHVRKFSDTLLMFETKRRDPDYRDSVAVKHSGTIDLPKVIRDLDELRAKAAAEPEQPGETRH